MKGIPKTNLQAFVASIPESLQSQKRSTRQNRLSLKGFRRFSRATAIEPAKSGLVVGCCNLRALSRQSGDGNFAMLLRTRDLLKDKSFQPDSFDLGNHILDGPSVARL
jgi:hypothetical protein